MAQRAWRLKSRLEAVGRQASLRRLPQPLAREAVARVADAAPRRGRESLKRDLVAAGP